jgi:hypothetical protein
MFRVCSPTKGHTNTNSFSAPRRKIAQQVKHFGVRRNAFAHKKWERGLEGEFKGKSGGKGCPSCVSLLKNMKFPLQHSFLHQSEQTYRLIDVKSRLL